MKLRLVLLALSMLSYGSTNAVPVKIKINQIIIETEILTQHGFKDELSKVLKTIKESQDPYSHQISDRTWVRFSSFLSKNNLICLQDNNDNIYFIQNKYYENLNLFNHPTTNQDCLMVTKNGVHLYKNNQPGKYKESLRSSAKEAIAHENRLMMTKGMHTNKRKHGNGHVDTRARNLKNLTEEEMRDLLTSAGVEQLGYPHDENLDITIVYNNNSNNNNSNNNNNSTINEDVCRSDLSDDSDANTSFSSIIDESNNSEDFFLLDNNNNNEVNESGYLDEDGNFVPNNNCHHYVVDEDGEINYYRNDRGYFSE